MITTFSSFDIEKHSLLKVLMNSNWNDDGIFSFNIAEYFVLKVLISYDYDYYI